MLKTLFIFFLFSCLASCKSKPSLIGRWKVDHLVFIHSHEGKFAAEDSVDINNRDFLTIMLNKSLGTYYNPGQIDSIVNVIQNSFLTLNSDSTYELVDAGSLARDTLGLFTQGRANGKWQFNSKLQILRLQISSTLTPRYKVVKLEDNVLMVHELYEETNEPIIKIRLIRK